MEMKTKQLIITFICAFSLISFPIFAQNLPIYDYRAIFHPVTADQGMVATQEDLATQAGLAVLQRGGNAIDAAVTIGFTLAVTLPRAGNLGGGGFMLIHLAENAQTIALDYREKAPLAATESMFLSENGTVDRQKIRFSHLAAGVPGTVAGLITALEKYGTISLAEALQPAIILAEKGIIVDEDLANSLRFAQQHLSRSAASRTIFLKANGEPYQVGDRLIQKDLANSLKLIAKEGKNAFYQGEIAQKIATDMAQNQGIITLEDLAQYQPIIRQPIQGTYRGYDIYSMPPPSSGGVHLIQMLNILENFPLSTWGHNTAKTLHVMVEAMKFAYADRFRFLGDADFVEIPLESLISKTYGKELSQQINLNQTLPSENIAPNEGIIIDESPETTHYSVIDKDGNAVANTYTLNFSYGSGITVAGTGILLNNEMDDFTAKINQLNAYGLRGGEANKIEPEKRMLSSMTPTIVLKDNDVFLVTGSPGGSRIITIVLQVILNVIEHQMNIAEATNAVRIHHQWFPDKLYIEKGLNEDTLNLLQQKNHKIEESYAAGSTQSIMKIEGKLYGASDPRKLGALTLGY